MIRFDDIEVTFGEHIAIPKLNLEVGQGEFFTLLGPSGCGKTTALRTLAGFIEPSAGEIYIDGKAATKLPSEKRSVGMVFQNYALFQHECAGEHRLRSQGAQNQSCRDRPAGR
jgi:iron(III) transport system ATP-binding protein